MKYEYNKLIEVVSGVCFIKQIALSNKPVTKAAELAEKQVTASFRHSPFHCYSWPAASLISSCSMATPPVHCPCFARTEKGVCISNSSRRPAMCVYIYKSLFFDPLQEFRARRHGNGRSGNKGKWSEMLFFNPHSFPES